MQSSPRYEKWREILQSDIAPIISPTPIKSLLGAEMADVFRLNIVKLTADQRCTFGEPAHLRKKCARLRNPPNQSQAVVMVVCRLSYLGYYPCHGGME